MNRPQPLNAPRRKKYTVLWVVLALVLLVTFGCCFGVCNSARKPRVVEPYTGKKVEPTEGAISISGMDLNIWGDHAYSGSSSLGKKFSPNEAAHRCRDSEWVKQENKNLPKPAEFSSKSYVPKSIELYHCRPTSANGPSPIQRDGLTDRYAFVIDGVVLAYFFETTYETEREAKNKYQDITNFRLKHTRCKIYDADTNVHQCFQVFSQVEREGTRVVLIHATSPVYADIAHELAFGGSQRSRALTDGERKVIEKCQPLAYKCW